MPPVEPFPETPSGKRSSVWTIAALVVGLAIGYFAARGSAVPAQAPSPSDALGARLGEVDTLARTRKVAAYLRGASPQSLETVLDAYDSPGSRVSDLELVLLAEWWGRFDPAAAFGWIDSRTAKGRFTAPAQVFRVWARSNPADALKAADRVPGEHERRASLDAALIGWDESLDRGVGEYVYDLPPGNERQLAMAVLARRRVATLGAEEALAWASELPETKEFRQLMVPRVASAIAESNPEIAARWAEGHIDGETPTQLPRRIATRWLRQDPDAAFAWLESLPPGPDRNDGTMETFRDWMTRDREAASAWAESQLARAPSPWLDPVLFVYARAAGRRQPGRGVELAGLITDEIDRNAAYTVILRIWLRRDPEAAEAWIAGAGLPEDVVKRAHMLRRRQQRPGAD